MYRSSTDRNTEVKRIKTLPEIQRIKTLSEVKRIKTLTEVKRIKKNTPQSQMDKNIYRSPTDKKNLPTSNQWTFRVFLAELRKALPERFEKLRL